MRVAVIGANGFVGSAFSRLLTARAAPFTPVTRANYDSCVGQPYDVVIECACNAKKYLAENEPERDFEASVSHRLRTLLDFPQAFHIHISSVDVYPELDAPHKTKESTSLDASGSRYGFHKTLAEMLVRHYAPRWLIVRLAGMVGPGLSKNPVFDVSQHLPLRIHPDSRYQFMHTDEVARIVMGLYESGRVNEIFNVCGRGTVTPRAMARWCNQELDLTALAPAQQPRVVDIDIEKISQLYEMPSSELTVRDYLEAEPNVPTSRR